MIIGVDIDDTVADFKKDVEKFANKYDASLRNTGQINKNAWITKGRYDWSKEETLKFESFVFESIIENLDIMEDSNKYINKLKKMGNSIVFVTKRNKDFYKTPYESSKNWLDKNGFIYDKIVIDADDDNKATICKSEKIDVFIDDRFSICKSIQNEGIRAIMIVNDRNKKHLGKENVEFAFSWKEIYNLIYN